MNLDNMIPDNITDAYLVHAKANKDASSFPLSLISYSIKAALYTPERGIALPTHLVEVAA